MPFTREILNDIARSARIRIRTRDCINYRLGMRITDDLPWLANFAHELIALNVILDCTGQPADINRLSISIVDTREYVESNQAEYEYDEFAYHLLRIYTGREYSMNDVENSVVRTLGTRDEWY